jgi:hypothetical protein
MRSDTEEIDAPAGLGLPTNRIFCELSWFYLSCTE